MLERRIGALGGGLLTAGAVIGTGIFLAAGSVAQSLPHPALVLAAWAVGGLLTLAGAFTYAELGTMYPNAGGLYHFLREAWGRPLAFLYGWACLLVIMSGGIAAIATGFAAYAGRLALICSSQTVLLDTMIAGQAIRITGLEVTAIVAIALLTGANHVGLRTGAAVQHLFTLVKIAAIGGLIGLGFWLGRSPSWAAPLPGTGGSLLSGLGVALVAVLWTFDGWYALTFTAGEVREPARNLPRAMVLGVGAVSLLYLAINLTYLRALPVANLASSLDVGAAAAEALAGPVAGTAMTVGVGLSAFGCLAATILYSSRLYQPIAAEGLFFRSIARIHPRWHTPVSALWLQSGWAAVLVLSGSYQALFTYVTFAGTLFHVAAGLALFRLRATKPDAPRPYRAWGYPVVPAFFVAGMTLLTVNTFMTSMRESLWGLGIVASGALAYRAWSASSRSEG